MPSRDALTQTLLTAYANRDAAAALHAADRLLARVPRHLAARHVKAWALCARGELAAARVHFDELLREQPDYPIAIADYGLLLEAEQKLPEAAEAYGRAVTLAPRIGYIVIRYSNARELDDFATTAAVIGELDLVVSTDTAVAHLAGALARPTWTLLRHAPDWRWGMHGSRTPWYPSMRLFRQPRLGDWRTVVEAIVGELRRRQAAGD